MKRYAVALLPLLLLVPACKKEAPPPPGCPCTSSNPMQPY